MTGYRNLIAALITLTLEPPAMAQLTLSRAQMTADVDELVATIRREYSYLDEKKKLHGLELDVLRANALKGIERVESNSDFHDMLAEAVAGLKDGHCEIRGSCEVVPRAWPKTWPVVLLPAGKDVVVVDIHKSVVGIGRGDRVVAVDGTPIEELIAETAKRVSASTDGARRRLALQRVTHSAEPEVKLWVEHADGREVAVLLKTCFRSELPVPAVPGVPDLAKDTYIEHRVLEGDVGYVRITSLSWGRKLPTTSAAIIARFQPVWDEIDKAFTAVADKKTLVLDLRGNTGGYDHVGAHVACHFLAGDFHYHTWQPRYTLELKHWHPRPEPFPFYAGPVYAGRLALLIDEMTFSATDMLVAALKDTNPAIRLVGRPTHGGAGGPREVVALKHSQVPVTLCTMRLWGPSGRLIEGLGTKPDVPVEWTRDDVLRKNDPDVAAALRELRR